MKLHTRLWCVLSRDFKQHGRKNKPQVSQHSPRHNFFCTIFGCLFTSYSHSIHLILRMYFLYNWTTQKLCFGFDPNTSLYLYCHSLSVCITNLSFLCKTPFFTVSSCCRLSLTCGAIIQTKFESRRDENQQLSTKTPQACSCCSSQQLIIKDRFKIDSPPVGNFVKHRLLKDTLASDGPKVEFLSFLGWAKQGLRGTWGN